jgi:sulfur relay (sulfurtransferase) DsrF/TusC family protein
MDNQPNHGNIGFIITKAPLENSSIKKILSAALEATKNNKIGFFLISDGVFLIKKNQKNETYDIFIEIISKKVEIIVSKDHLESAGLSSDEILSNLIISDKPYDDLVDFVMEKYERVITL